MSETGLVMKGLYIYLNTNIHTQTHEHTYTHTYTNKHPKHTQKHYRPDSGRIGLLCGGVTYYIYVTPPQVLQASA